MNAAPEFLEAFGRAMQPGDTTVVRERQTVKEARKMFLQEEVDRILQMDSESVEKEAIRNAEENGIVFIDEIDKICHPNHGRNTPDASTEGVQRDLLPLVEGCEVEIKLPQPGVPANQAPSVRMNTDHILFIGCGAFHSAKPSDLIPELQGRFPVRVTLDNLTEEDYQRILTEPEQSLLGQQVKLLGTEGLDVEFDEGAVMAIAKAAVRANKEIINIGARRLITIVEVLSGEISFEATAMVAKHREEVGDPHARLDYVFTEEMVDEKLEELFTNQFDTSKYIL